MQSDDEALAAKFAALLPHLDERRRRLVLGAEARALGHGGITAVARAARVSAVTVSKGVAELAAGGKPQDRARRPGGGRKPVTATDPGLRPALLALMEPAGSGDPAPLQWTTKSTRQLARALTAGGRVVSAPTVAKLLRAEGFSLQGKSVDGRQLKDRDAQFHAVRDRTLEHLSSGDPVISVNATSDEIADIAVATIRAWWHRAGQVAYPRARRLLIVVSGAGNGTRAGVWKAELVTFAGETSLPLTVCHLPSGTSKWTAVGRRAVSRFCLISAGAQVDHEVAVQAVSATGCDLDQQVLLRREFDGEWNYELIPGAS